MDSMENNKGIVTRFFECISAGDIPGMLDCMTDDARWQVVGHPEASSFVRVRNKREIQEMFEAMAGLFPRGLRIAPTGMTAEGDRVAVEAESSGVKTDGEIYNSLYHFLCVVEEGKIRAVREYCDLNYVQRIFG